MSPFFLGHLNYFNKLWASKVLKILLKVTASQEPVPFNCTRAKGE
jgi:hypothetical protein